MTIFMTVHAINYALEGNSLLWEQCVFNPLNTNMNVTSHIPRLTPTLQRAFCFSARKADRLMHFEEVTFVYCGHHKRTQPSQCCRFLLNPAIHNQQLNSIKLYRKNNGEGCLSCSALKIQVIGEVTLRHLINIKKIPATPHKKSKKFLQNMYRLTL